MKARNLLLLTSTLLVAPAIVHAQETAVQDSVPETKEVKNRNVMLNASSDNQPRQISIGLPSSLSTTIMKMDYLFHMVSGPVFPIATGRAVQCIAV